MTKSNQSRTANPQGDAANGTPPKRGRKPRPIVEFPEPLDGPWIEPGTFPEAFVIQLECHGETCWHLHNAVIREGEAFDRKTFRFWANGEKLPNSIVSFDVLSRVERRYRLPEGYFRSKIPKIGRAPSGFALPKISAAERRRIAWHLPADFDRRSAEEQTEILEWVRSVIISGSTDFRRYQAEAMKTHYGLRFPADLRDRGAGVRS